MIENSLRSIRNRNVIILHLDEMNKIFFVDMAFGSVKLSIFRGHCKPWHDVFRTKK